MSSDYSSISKVWSEFPKEFENSCFNNDINTWKARFENRAYLFDKYITKIILIADVSTGKSTLINALLGNVYLGARGGHGTTSFYYCSLSEKDYEYFTMNNSDFEYQDISALPNASIFSDNGSDDINHTTVIKLYIQHDESQILQRKTVIVDCPGFGQEQEYDREIRNHCSTADLFIFMFQFDKPASENQIRYIKDIRRIFNNPKCFFVYNKCELPQFNAHLQITLRDRFYNYFNNQEARELRLHNDPLYFISARETSRFPDFDRLKEDIKIYRDSNFIRFSNFQSLLPNEINDFCRRLNIFVCNQEKEITSLLTSIKELKFCKESQFPEINICAKKCINNCEQNLPLERIVGMLHKVIGNYNRICYKENACEMISAIEETFSQKAIKFIEINIIDSCIDPINQIIMLINKSNTSGNLIAKDLIFKISTNPLDIPRYKNIENLFWFFEFGNKTAKIKEHYMEFIESKSIEEKIKSSIKLFYENEFRNIRRNIENSLKGYNMEYATKEKELNDNLSKLRSDREKLATYERNIKSDLQRFIQTSIN